MDKKQKQVEVLLVADKDDDGKLKAVDKSAAKDGLLRLLLPSMENIEDFMKVEKHSSILKTSSTTYGASISSRQISAFTKSPHRCWKHWTYSPTCSKLRTKTRISLSSIK